jgi:hypothetical protein
LLLIDVGGLLVLWLVRAAPPGESTARPREHAQVAAGR